MEISFEEKMAAIKAEEAATAVKRAKVEEEETIRKEIIGLLPKDLRKEYESESEAVKTAQEYLAEAKTAFGAAREKQKAVERRIGDVLNGEQLKVFLGNGKLAVSVGGIGRGKQGARILEMIADKPLLRKDMVEVLKAEFNGADCHGAFDTLKKGKRISIIDGIVTAV